MRKHYLTPLFPLFDQLISQTHIMYIYICSIDVVQAQKEAAKAPHCPLEIRASDDDNALGVDYFRQNKESIWKELLQYGAIWFRGFDLMKSVSGHREMYEAIELQPCLDPLHSSGLRKFSSERDALYEEVRKITITKIKKNTKTRSLMSFISEDCEWNNLLTFSVDKRKQCKLTTFNICIISLCSWVDLSRLTNHPSEVII